MNNPICKANQLYEQNNGDFAETLKWHLFYGVVVSLRDCFVLGYFCDRKKVGEPLQLSEANCIYITMCVGDMQQGGMQIVDLVDWIAYERQFKGDRRIRVTNFKNFYRKLK